MQLTTLHQALQRAELQAKEKQALELKILVEKHKDSLLEAFQEYVPSFFETLDLTELQFTWISNESANFYAGESKGHLGLYLPLVVEKAGIGTATLGVIISITPPCIEENLSLARRCIIIRRDTYEPIVQRGKGLALEDSFQVKPKEALENFRYLVDTVKSLVHNPGNSVIR